MTMDAIAFARFRRFVRIAVLTLVAVLTFGSTCPAQSLIEAGSRTIPPTIVVGFVGGFVKHDNLFHGEVQLAARLRQAYPIGLDVEMFENHDGEIALKRVLGLLDTNHDGTLVPQEKQSARIIIYGHSWGASEGIALARELQTKGVPVLLTIQVDSVSKMHENGAVIPANVARAVNFYQPDGLIHGRSSIRAADPTRTNIIGNFRFDYKASAYNCAGYPWFDRIFMKSHIQIECDANVWNQAESLIRSALPVSIRSTAQE
jgi:hypothetical protein